MAKTETVRIQGVSRTWLPPLDGGTLLMVVLIGFMGFYVLYPLILILINSFNTATIAEPPAYGLQAWKDAFNEPGIRRSLLEQPQDRHRASMFHLALGYFHLMAYRPNQHPFFQCL